MTDFERDARAIFRNVVADCDPGAAFDRHVTAEPGAWIVDGHRVELDGDRDVRVVAVGKSSHALLAACARALDRAGVAEHARLGVAAVPACDASRVTDATGTWLDVEIGGHPFPTAGSFRAGRKILELCSKDASERTLVIALIGGGGSAMAEWPNSGRTGAEALHELSRRLVRTDLSIREINAVRKRVSAIKGGRLAIVSRPARVLTLLVSDVPVGDIGSIASGPTIEDNTVRAEAVEAIAKVEGTGALPANVRALIADDSLSEPPSWTEDDRRRAHSVVLVDSADVSSSAERHATNVVDVVRNLGVVDGPIDAVVTTHLEALATVTAAHPGTVCAVVSSGEATLNVRGVGTGGRNQHFALSALVDGRDVLRTLSDFAILSAGTDGLDGNSTAAGAVVVPGLLDGTRIGRFDAMTALAAFDAATFLARVDAQLVCGPTGTNVRDLRVLIGVRR